ncbi:Pleckstrin homology-like domain [Plasmopara halstedii]|uniref:Pleckstrin homology-like domain n=1 Tax=Plasmopara halstedii TaxID=4781 RepID=A0A0P1B0W1_PLAHL|nr:Pleckstrin homology-like domain [Plasmopara halstedii]CEG47526.1 Pleckstrin homology-like domain [Plasmopara halstedii]|eukprot:XP_024583895.1 Pleckstrin homology-like domain [Plasmopara halstedii]
MSSNSSVYTTMSKSKGKMFTLHRRQSALNLPLQTTRDCNTSVGMQPTLLELDELKEVKTSQRELLPTAERFGVKFNSTSQSAPDRQISRDVNPEKCGSPTISSRGQQMFDSLRSRHGSVNHLRTLSRDFLLHSLPTSSIRHENLTSLKDQFLKIKERFSLSVLPLPNTTVAIETSSGLDDVSATCFSVPLTSDQTLCEPLFKDLDSSWEHSQAHVRRWFREDNCYKASITCWTMEVGASIVSKVARIVSEWAENMSNNHMLPAFDNSNFMNPDVSLQWIGQQLWAVTISLPLSRSNELHAEQITLAYWINQMVADESKQASTQTFSLPSNLSCEPRSIKTQVDVKPTQAPPMKVIIEPDGENAEPDETDASPFSTLAAEDIDILRLQQAQMADNEEIENEYARREDEELGDQCQNDNEEEEENSDEQASALPLSWSMLSLSSQRSGSSEHASIQAEFAIADDCKDPISYLAPEKIGWLKKKRRKQHGIGSSWQPRYFELKGNRLYYFASEAEGLPRGAVLMDHALVQRGRGEHSMVFSISSASSHQRLQVLKFSARLAHQVLPRKSIELRVIDETDVTVSTWIAALNRASCHYIMASSTLPAHYSSSCRPYLTFDKKRKTPFYRFRSSTITKTPLAASSLSSTLNNERLDAENIGQEKSSTTSTRWIASYQQLGSVRYLRETDPLLWEIHPPDQIAIRKKAAQARTRSEYLAIFSRHADTFSQIFLPRPQPISLEQTLRDILPELFLINGTLYGGGEQLKQQTAESSKHDITGQPNCGLEHIFEVLDTYIQRFAAAPEDRVRAVSALLQACARTISGGDSYFVVHRLLGNSSLIIRPAEARGRPIKIDVSPDRPSRFLITVFSAFSFHLLDDVERFGDSNDAHGSGTTPAPLLRVCTRHIQEFDFAAGTSARWLKIDVESQEEDVTIGRTGGGSGTYGRWSSRRQSQDVGESRIGALLDALS